MCTLLKRKTFPAFPELGSNLNRETGSWTFHLQLLCGKSLGGKEQWKTQKSSRDCSYSRRKQEGKSGLWLLEICWWLKSKSLDTTNFSTGVCTCKSGRQNTCQFDCCMEIRMYSNSNSAYQHFYESDSYPNNAYYVKDPYSENRRDLFPL